MDNNSRRRKEGKARTSITEAAAFYHQLMREREREREREKEVEMSHQDESGKPNPTPCHANTSSWKCTTTKLEINFSKVVLTQQLQITEQCKKDSLRHSHKQITNSERTIKTLDDRQQ